MRFNGGIIGPKRVSNTSVVSGIFGASETQVLTGAKEFAVPATGYIPPQTDQYFNHTTLLLSGDGTNGAQNSTFLDSSSNSFTITRNGNATQGSFSPFNQAGWSNYFDDAGTPSSSYITTSSSSNLAVGDFTLEFFINWTKVDDISSIMDLISYLNGFSLRASTTGLFIYMLYTNGGGLYTSPTITWVQGKWYHIALVRSGATLYWYADGVLLGTSAAVSTTFSTGQARIGGILSGGVYSTTKYISNLRLVNSALYTGSTLTVPTSELTAISGTVLLTCQSNRFIDKSSSGLTITPTGTPTSVQPHSPFAPSVAYSAATNGGSGYFDGSGDYCDTAVQSVFQYTGDFTMEGWFYPTGSGFDSMPFGQKATEGIQPYINANGSVEVAYNSTVQFTTSAGVVIKNQWNHIAVTRSGTEVRCYVNGVSVGTTTTSGTIGTTSAQMGIACRPGGAYLSTGYVSDVRVVNGTAVYTGTTLTVPTAPLTAIANTRFLCKFQNIGIIDSTAKNNLETVGDAQIDTNTKKYGTGSIKLDSSGDYLIIPNNPKLMLSTNNFTVEAWVYPTMTAYQTVVCLGRYNSNAGVLRIQDNNTVRWYFNDNSVGVTTSNTVTTNAWNHICACRSGTTTRVFINGVLGGSFTDSSNYNSTYQTVIGAEDQAGSFVNLVSGFIDDLRVTIGIARYTSNFTPPTSAFELQ